MNIGQASVKVGDSPELGPVQISIHQPQPELPVTLDDVYDLLLTTAEILKQIELNTRPRSLWERIKIWLGIH